MPEEYPLKAVKRFDMSREPKRVKWYLRPITWIIAFPAIFRHHTKITKSPNLEGLKPPYLLLCNHNSFYDMKVATCATFPHQAYFVVELPGFVGFFLLEWLMRNIGCIGKRKFTNDINLIRNLQRVIDRKKIAAMYPEARYSLCGTNAVLPPALGKLAKMLRVPVVTLMTNGNHIIQPFYNQKVRKIKTTANMEQIITQEEILSLSIEEINERINKAFVYDDFKWQKENKVKNTYKKRAQGVHKVLYQCPHCKKEYRMESEGTKLWCKACGHQWEMDEYGQLHAIEGETYYSHVPDWYEWERENVRKEVQAGTYHYEGNVNVKSLPNSRGFISVGNGTLVHNMDGFELKAEYEGGHYSLKLPTQSLYSVHIEYNYKKEKRDCIDMSTLNETFFVYPQGEDFSVTKMSLATEELFDFYHQTHKVEAATTAKERNQLRKEQAKLEEEKENGKKAKKAKKAKSAEE